MEEAAKATLERRGLTNASAEETTERLPNRAACNHSPACFMCLFMFWWLLSKPSLEQAFTAAMVGTFWKVGGAALNTKGDVMPENIYCPQVEDMCLRWKCVAFKWDVAHYPQDINNGKAVDFYSCDNYHKGLPDLGEFTIKCQGCDEWLRWCTCEEAKA